MAKTVWMRSASEARVPGGVDVSLCAICEQTTSGRGAIVEVQTPHVGRVYRAVCDVDAQNPDQVAAMIRATKTPRLHAV